MGLVAAVVVVSTVGVSWDMVLVVVGGRRAMTWERWAAAQDVQTVVQRAVAGPATTATAVAPIAQGQGRRRRRPPCLTCGHIETDEGRLPSIMTKYRTGDDESPDTKP